MKIAPKDSWRSFIREWLLGLRIDDYLISATIEAVKPRTASHQSLLAIEGGTVVDFTDQ